jgi:glycosyltransferase involved in cell wall biosynthesis
MLPISVIITTHNEAHNIEGILATVGWADEVIIVDSFSTDETLQLAAPFEPVVYQRAYTGPADQKNWVIPKAKNEWILLLDADERVTPALRQEIEHWLQQDDIPFDAFWIGRRNHFLGKEIRYSGWQGDKVVRFFRRDKCRYNDKQVHEEIMTSNIRVSQLKAKCCIIRLKTRSIFYPKWNAMPSGRHKIMSSRPKALVFSICWESPCFVFLNITSCKKASWMEKLA